MSLNKTIYFMALVGWAAGLLCWCIVIWCSEWFAISQESFWILDLFTMTVLGGLIGGLTVWFADRWTGDQLVLRWVAAGAIIGMVAGAFSGLIGGYVASASLANLLAYRVLSWMIAGALIGFGTGLRWVSLNRNRILHAVAGGLVGGTLGGFAFALQVGRIADLSSAIGLILTGAGITCGLTLAPMLIRDAVLRFKSSGDAQTVNKLLNSEWVLHENGEYLIGRLGARQSLTMSARVYVWIPDPMVAERHAVIKASKHRFYIDLHSENRSNHGMPKDVLQLRGEDVISPRELVSGDIVTIGRTLLEFRSRRSGG